MKAIAVLGLVLLCAIQFHAQDEYATLNLEIRAGSEPVNDAEVKLGEKTYRSDQQGRVSISVIPGGIELSVTAAGYAPQTVSFTVVNREEKPVTIEMTRIEESITVTATRSGRHIEDEATRVEVLDREEVEEKMMMTPGDIVMMLNEMGGLRVQATSPSLGAASVRIQGMRGRYTRFLSDGLPLFGQQVGGLGLLQIPPMDLGQVEVIKGVSSALYGAGAMGGVVNLVSRRPTHKVVREFLLNQSSRGATDGVFFLAGPTKGNWSGSLLGGAHFQIKNDVNGDGWADLPGYKRGVIRPRIFWDNQKGSNIFVTAGFTYEDRNGGTVANGVLPATGLPYTESLESRNFDVGTVAQTLIGGKYLFAARFAMGRRSHRHVFGEILERDDHDTLFSEVTLRRVLGRHTLVGGAAYEAENYHPRDVPRFEYRHHVPGAFVQDDFDVSRWFSFSAGGRYDHQNVYGNFFSPRVSALLRSHGWKSRLSWGRGFFAPTPLTEETEAAGLSRLKVPQSLQAERGESFSVDLTKTLRIVTSTVTLFDSRISHPLEVDRATYTLLNLQVPARNMGVELLSTMRFKPYSVTASYTFVQSTKNEGGQRLEVPLTPRHSAGIVAMWESEEKGRIGIEMYYTGAQRLEANPFRDGSEPYFIMGFLGERRFGRFRLFINAENLTDVRQTKWDPLLLPTRAVDGRWTVDAWAPLEGRTFNGGVRMSF